MYYIYICIYYIYICNYSVLSVHTSIYIYMLITPIYIYI